MAAPQPGVEGQPQPRLCVDESGFYPLPSVGRTDAPVGQTPLLREWCPRDHLAAISAISPEGQVSGQSQACAITSADVVAVLAPLLRKVPGQLVIIWDGAPIPRRHLIKEFFANGAVQRHHWERLPACAPELTPDEGFWQSLTGVELRNGCDFDRPRLRNELRDAVKRLRRKPRLSQGFFRAAKL